MFTVASLFRRIGRTLYRAIGLAPAPTAPEPTATGLAGLFERLERAERDAPGKAKARRRAARLAALARFWGRSRPRDRPRMTAARVTAWRKARARSEQETRTTAWRKARAAAGLKWMRHRITEAAALHPKAA